MPTELRDAPDQTRPPRRIAVSVLDGDEVTSVVLPDTLVSATLGANINEIAEALTAGASADPAFARDGGEIIESVTRHHPETATTQDEQHPAPKDGSVRWLRIATHALMLGIPLGIGAGPLVASAASAAAIDAIIENEQLRLKILQMIRGLNDADEDLPSGVEEGDHPRKQVQLDSPTGQFTYDLPLSVDETFSASEVGVILSPTGKGLRTIAKQRRDANDLLGVKVGNQYRYPKFQLDVRQKAIKPVVTYANRAWESSADPWGTLEWWYSPEDVFGDRRPVDLIAADELTTKMIDKAVAHAGAGMD